MEEGLECSPVPEGVVRGIKFTVATSKEICTYSINDCPISHPSQLSNPFLGLPLESGKCESCGTAEAGQCEGHFGYIQLPVPVYHPSHIIELKDVLSLVCFKCMRLKNAKVKDKAGKSNVSTTTCKFCRDLPALSIKITTSDGASFIELSVSARTNMREGFWNFLNKFGGFRTSEGYRRPLLPVEALNILKEIPEETRKRMSAKGYFPQDGYILQYLVVPPNCLLVPEISDGKSIMCADVSRSLLKRVLSKIDHIKRSRSGNPNFEAHLAESNDLQLSIAEYMQLRGTTKTPNVTRNFALGKEASEKSSKQWLEKMKTLFISKASGFSSRSVITGDSYIGMHQIGLPQEIAQKVTFEERVTTYNLERMQKLVDDRLIHTYKDGNTTYSITRGSKGHTLLKVGQVVSRSIVDGDIVFINRPPSTHKHSLQAFSVFIHEGHTVKINPLVCAPFGADFDGDCVHIFYPQSLAAKAEVLELFSVQEQLVNSHTGKLNLQLVSDSLLSLKVMDNLLFLKKDTAQQLSMFVSPVLPFPAVFSTQTLRPLWTIHQILQSAFPSVLDCVGQRHHINQSEILKLEFNRDLLQSSFTEIITSALISKGPKVALNFFNTLQPLLMEVLALSGFSVSLKDFYAPRDLIEDVQNGVQQLSGLCGQLQASYNELLELQVENQLRALKSPITSFILESSSLGSLIDSRSESSINKVTEQVGFLGLQLSDRGKLYSKSLVLDIFSSFVTKHAGHADKPPCEAYGLVKSSFFSGLKSFEAFVHAINTREVIVRSSRGLTEPGTLFKNLMAILRDVVICYDETVRNVCSNSLIQLEYGDNSSGLTPPGEPVGVLAATAIANVAYKAVLDSSKSTVSSWELMKEILLSKANYKNDAIDRRVILYLNDCSCGKKFCRENAALTVQNCLRRVTLKQCAIYFSIEYLKQTNLPNPAETAPHLVGHIHLDRLRLDILNQNADGILHRCQDAILDSTKKKKSSLSRILKRISLSASECTGQLNNGEMSQFPCLQFSYCAGTVDESLDQGIQIMGNIICPFLLDTIVKGDPRVDAVSIVWIGPEATSWVRNPHRSSNGELALEVVIEKDAARQNGDAWRTVLDAALPVMHLVDTKRSIPYGIQQIKLLFGISCAFDQHVQRLSKCMRMVSRGVINEHLILVGNSVTSTGNLIGFNTGGFKALFKSLKIQVPFTEATLFTPMKCFDRAAEKCHTDSLGSVVSSTAWGKHVALGTGTNFDIIWGQKQQAASNEDIGKDIYDLLSWVREPREKDQTGTCIGSDVDDFFDDIQEDDMPLSPDPNTNEKPTFEDYTETESSWQLPGNTEKRGLDESDSWGGWGTNKKAAADNSDNCDGWGNKEKPSVNNSGSGWGPQNVQQPKESTWAAKKPVEVDSSSGWDANWGKKAKEVTDTENSSSWMARKPEEDSLENGGWATKKPTSGWNESGVDQGKKKTDSGWKEKTDNESSWGAKKPEKDSSSGWTEKMGNGSAWTAKKPESISSSGWMEGSGNQSSWAAKKPGQENSSGWKEKMGNQSSWAAKTPESNSNSGWNGNAQISNPSSWIANKPSNDSSGWNENAKTDDPSPWTAKKPKSDSPSGWNENTKKGNSASWTAKEPEPDRYSGKNENAEMGTSSPWTAKKPESGSSSGWNMNNKNSEWSAKKPSSGWNDNSGTQAEGLKEPDSVWKEKTDNASPWSANKHESNTSSGWKPNSENPLSWSAKKPDTSGWSENTENNPWASKGPGSEPNVNVENSENTAWASKKPEVDTSTGWETKKTELVSPSGWNTGKRWSASTTPEAGSSGGWNDKKGNQGWKPQQGWGSNLPDRRGQRNNTPGTQGRPDNRRGEGPRQERQAYTNEEEKILFDIQPVIDAIRKISREAREGERLSPEDQKFVLENVFHYHPDKQSKVVNEIDYIVVDKHGSFRESRCFYVVSTDGSRTDFSYLKCMQNFIKERYPEHGDSFNGKFFWKRSEPVANNNEQQQSQQEQQQQQ